MNLQAMLTQALVNLSYVYFDKQDGVEIEWMYRTGEAGDSDDDYISIMASIVPQGTAIELLFAQRGEAEYIGDIDVKLDPEYITAIYEAVKAVYEKKHACRHQQANLAALPAGDSLPSGTS